jgi:hypothetical protein
MTRPLDLDNFVADKLAWHQQVATDPNLSLSAKAVAGLILHDLNADRGGAWRGQDSMASKLGVSVRHLRRLLKELEEASYLEVEVRSGCGRTNICRATRPVISQTLSDKQDTFGDVEVVCQQPHRTPVTAQTSRKRTMASSNPDTGVRQSLYEPIRFRRTPPSRARPISTRRSPTSRFAAAEIRSVVVRLAGEDAAVSYLDPTIWDADSNTITCNSKTGYQRLWERVGRALAARGVSIVLNADIVRAAA